MSVFVVFCRICSHKTDKGSSYNPGMDYLNRYIPREYLALKINYCRQQLEVLPKSTLIKYKVRGEMKNVIQVGKHRYFLDSDQGKEHLNIFNTRNEIERQLQIYEAIWNYRYKDFPSSECMPHKVIRTLYVDTNKSVVMNRAFFDSLENDANTDYPKFKNNFFNGIYYRSAAERDIAIFYTEMGIPLSTNRMFI